MTFSSARADHLETRAGEVPAVTLGISTIKVLATTLGETGGDTLSMSMTLGHLAAILVGMIACQMSADRFRPALCWGTVVASTTAGTTLADFATRSVSIGYAGGSTMLLGLVLASLGLWRLAVGRISSDDIMIGAPSSSTGSPSPSPGPSAPLSATGSPTPEAWAASVRP